VRYEASQEAFARPGARARFAMVDVASFDFRSADKHLLEEARRMSNAKKKKVRRYKPLRRKKIDWRLQPGTRNPTSVIIEVDPNSTRVLNLTQEQAEELAVRKEKVNHLWMKHQELENDELLPLRQAAGEELYHIRELVGHGHWMTWVEKNFKGKSVQTAERWIKLWLNKDKLAPIMQVKPNLTQAEALKRIEHQRFGIDQEAAPTKRQVIKVDTPIGAARRKFDELTKEQIGFLSDEGVMFVIRYAEELYDRLWNKLRGELGLAYMVIRADMKLAAGMAKIGRDSMNRLEGMDEETWKRKRAKYQREHTRSLVEGLEDFESLSEFERDLMLEELLPIVTLNSRDGREPDRESIRADLWEHLGEDKELLPAINHVADLLGYPKTNMAAEPSAN
jgi:hypothetical protein